MLDKTGIRILFDLHHIPWGSVYFSLKIRYTKKQSTAVGNHDMPNKRTRRYIYMFRMWGKIWKNNHMLQDTVICQTDYSQSRTAMVFQSLDDICYEFDLSKPIWLDANIEDFKRHDKTRFSQDNFIEQIDFDFLEIQVIEE